MLKRSKITNKVYKNGQEWSKRGQKNLVNGLAKQLKKRRKLGKI